MQHDAASRHKHGAKFAQSSRHEIKQRIQEKQSRLRDATRQARLSDVRNSDDVSMQPPVAADTARFSGGACAYDPPYCHDEEEATGSSCRHLGDEDWSAIAQEFGCDISDPHVMDWLLALEEEIRQEELFAFFDDAHTTEEQWNEYYRSLAEHSKVVL